MRTEFVYGCGVSPKMTLRCLLNLWRFRLHDCFKLRPDLLIESRQPVQTKVVMDTKWKLVNSNDQKKSLYGLAQSDFYQMFAYGQKYLGGTGEMYLIYPAHDDFDQPILQHFSFSETLKLWVVPYQITAKRGERIMWMGDVPYS